MAGEICLQWARSVDMYRQDCIVYIALWYDISFDITPFQMIRGGQNKLINMDKEKRILYNGKRKIGDRRLA